MQTWLVCRFENTRPLVDGHFSRHLLLSAQNKWRLLFGQNDDDFFLRGLTLALY